MPLLCRSGAPLKALRCRYITCSRCLVLPALLPPLFLNKCIGTSCQRFNTIVWLCSNFRMQGILGVSTLC